MSRLAMELVLSTIPDLQRHCMVRSEHLLPIEGHSIEPTASRVADFVRAFLVPLSLGRKRAIGRYEWQLIQVDVNVLYV